MTRLLVADVSGTPYERGYAQGGLFGARVREQGTMDFYRKYCEAEAVAGSLPVARHLLRGLHTLAASRFSEDAKKLIVGYCAASGDDPVSLAQAMVMPDVLNFLIGSSARISGAPVLGCTSVAAWGEYTKGGRFLVGRNLDYVGNGLYDRLPLVTRVRPKTGIPYAAVGTAGVVVDGATGMNEEGLTVALHQHVTTDVSCTFGRPIIDLAREILTQARTLEEACAIAAAAKIGGGWSIVVGHGKKRRAGVIHRTPRRFCLHEPASQALAFANTFTEPTMRANELGSPPFRESSRLREQRAAALLDAWRGEIDEHRIALLLRDHWDPERHRLRGFAQTIAQPNNLTSVIFDADEGAAWVAEGPAPACDGSYRKVELFSAAAVGAELPGLPESLPPEQRDGCRSYERAMSAWERNREPREPYQHLSAAVERDPGDAAYWYMRGLFALKLGDEKVAASCFEEGSTRPDLPHRTLAQKLWLARAYDLLGKRSQALPLYAYVCERAVYKPLAQAASKGLGHAYRTPTVLPDLFHADAHAY